MTQPESFTVRTGLAWPLFYAEAGSGFPLLLLHGNGEDHTYFSAQLRFFSQYYHVFAPDTRGHGASPRGIGPFTLERFADDLLEFLHAQALTRVHLLGFSDGANIAMLFALRHPELVEKLILNGGNLSPSGIRPSVQLPIELGYRIARLFAGRSPEARKHAEILGLMVNEPHIPPDALSALTMPVLVLAGTRDMVKRRHTEQIAASLPNAQLQFLNGDHFLAAKEPAAFNEAVLRFLREA